MSDQPNIYQQAAAELRDMAAGLEESVTINGAWPTGYDKEQEITFTLRRLAWRLETDAAVRAATIASLQAALYLSRAENNRLRDNMAASVRDTDRLYTLLDALVNEPQPLGIDRENYQNALNALEEVK